MSSLDTDTIHDSDNIVADDTNSPWSYVQFETSVVRLLFRFALQFH
jgi:hypothetical protein